MDTRTLADELEFLAYHETLLASWQVHPTLSLASSCPAQASSGVSLPFPTPPSIVTVILYDGLLWPMAFV